MWEASLMSCFLIFLKRRGSDGNVTYGKFHQCIWKHIISACIQIWYSKILTTRLSLKFCVNLIAKSTLIILWTTYIPTQIQWPIQIIGNSVELTFCLIRSILTAHCKPDSTSLKLNVTLSATLWWEIHSSVIITTSSVRHASLHGQWHMVQTVTSALYVGVNNMNMPEIEERTLSSQWNGLNVQKRGVRWDAPCVTFCSTVMAWSCMLPQATSIV